LIDRGSPNAYIPVWELIRDLGSDYEGVAEVLEKTWLDDEKKNRISSLKVEYKVTEIIREGPEKRRKEFINKVRYFSFA